MNARRPLILALVFVNLHVLPFLFWGLHSADTDTFYHLAGGRWMVENRQILDREVFSFTIPGRPWTNYYWLFECVLYGFESLAGRAGVMVFRGALILATVNVLLVWIFARTGGRLLETLAFGLVPLSLYLPRALNARPHLVSYLFLAVLLVRLERFQRSGRRFDALLVLLCVAWANLHGVEYPVVLAVVAIHAAVAWLRFRRPLAGLGQEPQGRRWVLLAAACALAFLVNPFGPRLLMSPAISLDRHVMAAIAEMAPLPWTTLLDLTPDLDSTLGSMAVLRYLLLTGAALLVYWARRREVLPAALFVLGAALALHKMRFVSELTILSVPFVAEAVARLRAAARPGRRLLAAALCAFIAYQSAALASAAYQGTRGGALEWLHLEWLHPGRHPVGPVRFLAAHGMEGNLYCPPEHAGYVTWSLFPAVRTFMDMRTPEPFDGNLLWVAGAVGRGVTLAAVDRRWPVDFVLLPRGAEAAAVRAEAGSPLLPVYVDAHWILLAHQRRLGGERAALRLSTFAAMEAIHAGGAPPPGFDEATLRHEAESLIRIWPDNELAQAVLLRFLLGERRFEEAHARAAGLIDRFPHQPGFLIDDARALENLGHAEEAAARLARAIQLAPDRLSLYPMLAEAYLRLDRAPMARTLLEAYFRRSDGSLSGREYALLANLRQRGGDLRSAADAYERALWLLAESDPLRGNVEADLAAIHLEAGDPVRALELAEAALRRAAPPPQAAFHRARALEEVGRREEARRAFQGMVADPGLPPEIRAAAERRLGNGVPP